MESNRIHGVIESRLSASSDDDDDLVIDDTANNGKQRGKICDELDQIFEVDTETICDKKLSTTVGSMKKGNLWSEMLIEDRKYEKMNEDLVSGPNTRRFFVDRNVETYPIWKRIAKIGTKKKKKKKKKKSKTSTSSDNSNGEKTSETAETSVQDAGKTIESNQQQNGQEPLEKRIDEPTDMILNRNATAKPSEPKSNRRSRIPDSKVVSEANEIAGKLQEKRIDIISKFPLINVFLLEID